MFSHYMLLMEVSNELSRQDLKNLLFCCGDAVSEADAEKIESGVDLFKMLKHVNRLKPDRYDYLKELLKTVGRVDLASKLPSQLKTILYKVPIGKKSFFCYKESSQESHSLISRNGHEKLPQINSSDTGKKSSSPRVVLLQIAEHLSTEDTSKLAFLFADKLSLNRGEKMKGTELLWQLETAGVIDPSQPETLAESLHAIGRKDLASLYVSMQSPQSILSSLNNSHQLLSTKISMFMRKKAFYSFQRNIMIAVLESDASAIEEQIVKPVTKHSTESYEYSVIYSLSMDALALIHNQTKFDRFIESTLSTVCDFTEAYLKSLHHYISSDSITIPAVEQSFETCRQCYNTFQEVMNETEWASAFQKKVETEIRERRTPTGNPACKALMCIYDICSELYGGTEIESAMKVIDQNLYSIEYLHYAYCCKVIMTQWLETLLCLLAGDFAESVTSYDCSLLRATLLEIVTKHLDSVSSAYTKISGVIGSDTAKRISEILLSEGVVIDTQASQYTNSSNKSYGFSEYVANYSVPVFTYVFLLLEISFFGSCNSHLSTISSRLTDFHLDVIPRSMPLTMKMITNVTNGYELQVDKFRETALKLNATCAPVIEQIIQI